MLIVFYFVNQYLLSNNSSIEHAEIKRLKLFKKNNVPAKLVTRDFSSILHENGTLHRFGLDDDQIVNMYDYFAGTVDYKGQQMHVEDLALPYRYQVGAGNSSREVKDGQQLIAEIFFIGGTIGQIDHVDYYDNAGNVTLRQKYDVRGFKAIDIFMGKDGMVDYEQYYRPDGTCYLERYYVRSNQNTAYNSRNILKKYKGRDRYFNGLDDLFVFFLNELNEENNDVNTFIADRPAASINPVISISGKAKKYLWLPISHVDDGDDQTTGPFNPFLQGALTVDGIWDGIITMTSHQAEALRQRIKIKTPIFTVNGSPVSPTKKIPMSKRKQNQLIYVGRLGKDKQTDRLIKMFAKIHQQVKNASLMIYGYGSPDDTKELKNLISRYHLEKVVKLAGYQVKLKKAYEQAQLFIDPSRIDGQPLAMAEALSYGLPVISYDYPYGPNEMIQPGENGELIPLNDEDKFIQTVVAVLDNPERLQRMSGNAYENLESINEDKTWEEWKKIITKD